MGAAAGLNAGVRAGMMIGNAVNSSLQRSAIDDINRATVQSQNQYTAQDGDQLAAIANARDPNGNPYYTLTAQDGGTGYNVQPNFQVQGADGQMQQAPTAAMAPRAQYSFLGKSYGETAPTAQQQMRGRNEAYADVIGRNDPEAALRMRSQFAREDMDQERLGFARDDHNYQMDQRRRTEDTNQLVRNEITNMQADLQKLGPAEFTKKYGGFFNDDPNTPMMAAWDEKTGKIAMVSHIPGHEGVNMISPMDLIQLRAGSILAANGGNPLDGLKVITQAQQGMQKRQDGDRDFSLRLANTQATAADRTVDNARQDRLADSTIGTQAAQVRQGDARIGLEGQRVALSRQTHNLQQQEFDAKQKAIRSGTPQNFTDEEGNSFLVTPRADAQGNALEPTVQAIAGPQGKKLSRVKATDEGANQARVTAAETRASATESNTAVRAGVKTDQQRQSEVNSARKEAAKLEPKAQGRYLASRGVAPAEFEGSMRQGKLPNGKPATRADYEDYNRTFPNSALPIPGGLK